MKIQKNKSLKNLNTYKIDAKAKYFFEITKIDDLPNIFNWMKVKKINKFFVLGGGSNIILLEKIYGGVVIKMKNTFTRWLSKNRVEVGAGRELNKFLFSLQKKGFFDIQSLAGVPGSVGAAVFGNAGCFGQETRKFVESVKVYNIKEKKFETFLNKDLNFSYRNSFLKENKDKYITYSVIFNFSRVFLKKTAFGEEYFSLSHFAKQHGIKNLTKKNIRKEILKIRRRVYPNLETHPNVGSTFQNARISKKDLNKIKKTFPDIPNWKLDDGKIKIPTAYIFDKVLGLNGKTFGNIVVDQKRPLFFVNQGGATGKEFYNLCQKIKKDIKKKIGIEIKEEVIFIK